MFLVDWAVKMRIRPPEFETSICDTKYQSHNGCGPTASCIPEPLRVTQVLDSKFPHGYSAQCVEHEKRISGSMTFYRSTGVKPGFDSVEGQNANQPPPSLSSLDHAAAVAADRRRRPTSPEFRSGLVFRGESDRADLVRTSSANRNEEISSSHRPRRRRVWRRPIFTAVRMSARDACATLDLPMVVDLIGIYGLKGPYSTLTTTDWFLQALSVIPRGSWGDVARRFTMIRWFWKLSRSVRSDRRSELR
ncbi:hypothetical protein F511_31941 [Dorcoceras hygrometricum]|uniref:DNA-directed RNA polymerase V subunit 1 n=1 Tax=Dorcoceras hygrometricum TaxID=472368 RepID=A0A2Z7AEY6_9LAMI|nr:hypothetical protein F511_31941 [Dorcoceras hygrometricum]